jgi:hypothetical protein
VRFLKTSLATIAAIALAGTPIVANAATSTSKTTEAKVKRVNKPTQKESKLGGGSGILIAAAAAAAIIIGIVVLSDDDEPTSP